MWARKSSSELSDERSTRELKARYTATALIILAIGWVFFRYPSVQSFLEEYKRNPEAAGMVLLTPLLLFFFYRNYVLHGGFGWTSERRCLGCGRTWYHSNDGWGFMSFGKNRPKWYQIKVCNTPEKCEIVGQHEIKWIP